MIKKFIWQNLNRLAGYDFYPEYCRIVAAEGNFHKLEQSRLEALLRHAWDNCPYYKDAFVASGLVDSKGKIHLQHFTNLPILTKEILAQEADRLKSADAESRQAFWNSTGGSTGTPVKFMQDRLYAHSVAAANNYYYHRFLDVDEPSVKKIVLWGSEKDLFSGSIGTKAKVLNYLTNTVFLNSFKMTPSDMAHYVKIINDYQPTIIKGYAGSLNDLCIFAKNNKLQINPPKAIVSEAENLYPEMRQTIEEVMGAKVYNSYGSREIGPAAGECSAGNLHIFTFRNIIEVVDRLGRPSHKGRVLVTNLCNLSMPLIRYEIGDLADLSYQECSCGSALPVLKKIEGRITDSFLLHDGQSVPGEFFIHLIGVVNSDAGIKQFQVIQKSYTRIEIRAIGGKLTPSKKFNIEQQIRTVMGGVCQVDWHIVKEIPKTPSGKFIYTKSLLK